MKQHICSSRVTAVKLATKKPNKHHVDKLKMRDTANYLVQYDCKGFVGYLSHSTIYHIFPDSYLTDVGKWISYKFFNKWTYYLQAFNIY